jgi:DNA repair protein RadD
MVPELRPFQLDLVERVRAARMSGSRIIVVQAATGAGKTTVAGYIAKQAVAKNSQVLFMAHRRKLIDQISARLEDFEINHGVIMSGEKLYSSASVQVASRDTLLSRCVRNDWLGMPKAGLVIVDEGHHAADPTSEYRRILECYVGSTILLLSATPVRSDGSGMGPWAQALECAAPTSQLVRDGYLVPVKCYAPDRKMHRGKARKGIAGDLVESWKTYAENMPTVLFCSRVQHSLDAVAAFKVAGIPAVHVDADTPDHVREAAFASLENEAVKVVSNVGIIGEGVDVPELGCCQLYCECAGRVAFLQRCGRIMRPHPKKTHGVLIDHSGAVFKHGFPDEDTEWTLQGNTDEAFKKKHDDGLTEPVHYCKHCELLYKGELACPSCGRMPVKPPRSIFAPPPVDQSDEILVEAERNGVHDPWSRELKIKHWMICLGVAASKNGSFAVAASIYKRKYNEFPGEGFPCVPARHGWKNLVLDVYPNFRRKKKQTT